MANFITIDRIRRSRDGSSGDAANDLPLYMAAGEQKQKQKEKMSRKNAQQDPRAVLSPLR